MLQFTSIEDVDPRDDQEALTLADVRTDGGPPTLLGHTATDFDEWLQECIDTRKLTHSQACRMQRWVRVSWHRNLAPLGWLIGQAVARRDTFKTARTGPPDDFSESVLCQSAHEWAALKVGEVDGA